MKNALLFSTLALAACTAGGVPTNSGAGGGTNISINLTLSQPVKTQWGESGGYTPAITNVPVGAQITFTNTDSFAHTATEIPNATQFPAGSPFGISATQQHGNTLSGGFTSGALQAGTTSQTIAVDRAGTYLFGCFFHYGAPMRAAIVAQ
ncbi:MAG TPA: plastocyanin/azurin family copper-binding protein [Candidatus Cybelea sp.]|jgi:plastocyanin|nr:plastocyanin/azurin family copper-binding protein [Candidatus Cybelea sp.]